MFGLPFFLPLVDFKTVVVPAASEPEALWGSQSIVALLALILGVLLVRFLLSSRSAGTNRSSSRRKRPPSRNHRSNRRSGHKPRRGNWIVVDGSNVMHWQDNTPRLAPVLKVIGDLQARGFDPGVVFDANAGWKLFGRYLNEHELGQMLGLPKDQVLVVPKGTQADPYILATAKQFDARIVTNDRYRDWADDHPEVTQPGFLIRGEVQGDVVRLMDVDAQRPPLLNPLATKSDQS